MNNNLILIDLDNTLIYGSYTKLENTKKLFQVNKYLSVYERPLARLLVELCQQKGDVIIYTTALKTYAVKISKALDINPIQILSRNKCLRINDKYYKFISPVWLESYEDIIIIDDSPNVWKNVTEKICFIVPTEFRGDSRDTNLSEVINKFIMNF